MTPTRKILFIVPYPLKEAPSQRFRFEQYFDVLQSNLTDYKVQSFLTPGNWRVFYEKGKRFQKVLALLSGSWRRTVGLLDAWQSDYVFIHREAAPIGPPVFEWVIAKVLRRRIIYDFDDAIWLTDKDRETLISRLAKWRGKVSTICKWSYRVSCGNEYLASYARKFTNDVVINPTTIDTERIHKPERRLLKRQDSDPVFVGWTGSHSTLKYLHMLEPVLQNIERALPQVHFLVIADKPPKLDLKRLTFVRWSKSSEIADLMKIDIGIMPLPDEEWSKGKCGFKILQYMSLCTPSVSSAVGVNTEIVQHGISGFLCSTPDEWFDCLRRLVESESLREKFGSAGRSIVVGRYSVNSNTLTFLSLFE